MAPASTSELNVASMAAGFTFGFGFLTVWEAIKQTKRNHNPRRSVYIYMIWGEILSNIIIGSMAYLLINGVVTTSVPVLLSCLIPWIFETQLLMQIIINRIAIIHENKKTIRNLKWGTAAVVTCINIAVICIWLPSHTTPPVNNLFVQINKYWDRMSKVLIGLVDALLNFYFIHTVRRHLVIESGLSKYAPLVGFNTKLMVASVSLDVLIIGLMSLPNGLLFLQFHPVVYIIKLNIEMTMANLIAKLARRSNSDYEYPWLSTANRHGNHTTATSHDKEQPWAYNKALRYTHSSKVTHGDPGEELGELEAQGNGIQKRIEVKVNVNRNSDSHSSYNAKANSGRGKNSNKVESELPLKYHATYPDTASSGGTAVVEERSRGSSSTSRDF